MVGLSVGLAIYILAWVAWVYALFPFVSWFVLFESASRVSSSVDFVRLFAKNCNVFGNIHMYTLFKVQVHWLMSYRFNCSIWRASHGYVLARVLPMDYPITNHISLRVVEHCPSFSKSL